MGAIIGFLVTKGLSEKLARVVAMGGLFVLILAAIGAGKCAYDRSVIAKHEAKQQVEIERQRAAQAERERKADANLERQRQADTNAAAARTKEIDDATKGLPDKAPSDRQRARACVELRRQGKAPAACA